MKKTKDYDLFIFRDDNRAKINHRHVDILVESIKMKNMLELKPISVNEKMEIIDGQHRLLAAKKLGCDIYFNVTQGADAKDIIAMNLALGWGIQDYLNFFIKLGNENYRKLEQFTREKNFTLQAALNITTKWDQAGRKKFKQGLYIFNLEQSEIRFQICVETIDKIKRSNGFSHFSRASRFWKALIRLTSHDDFDEKKWFKNMDKFIERFTPKANSRDYLKLFIEVHNFGNQRKIELLESEFFPKDDTIQKEETVEERHEKIAMAAKRTARQLSMFAEV